MPPKPNRRPKPRAIVAAIVPVGIVTRFRVVRTGEMIDSDGTRFWSAGKRKDECPDYHLELGECLECLGTVP
jgi:hypothetical protein